MSISPKDWSEIIRNLVSATAVVVGGFWVLYQWDTVFPKTRADVQSAAASVRTDVSGAFTVQLEMDDSGGGAPFRVPGSGEEQTDLSSYCAANPKATLVQSTPVFGQLKLKSASAIPVRARVERVLISTVPIVAGVISPAKAGRGAAAAAVTTTVATINDDRMFFGGLRENRVEKDQEIQVAVMLNAQIPLRCAELERLVLFQAEVALTGIDPAKDRAIGAAVPKVFVTACQLNPRTGANCNVQDVKAYGQ